MKKGFTLVELMIVIVIIGLLFSAVISAYEKRDDINKSSVDLIRQYYVPRS